MSKQQAVHFITVLGDNPNKIFNEDEARKKAQQQLRDSSKSKHSVVYVYKLCGAYHQETKIAPCDISDQPTIADLKNAGDEPIEFDNGPALRPFGFNELLDAAHPVRANEPLRRAQDRIQVQPRALGWLDYWTSPEGRFREPINMPTQEDFRTWLTYINDNFEAEDHEFQTNRYMEFKERFYGPEDDEVVQWRNEG